MESSVGHQAHAPQPEHRARPETNKERGQSKYQRVKEALAQEATAISDELERLQQAIEEQERALLVNKQRQAALDEEHKQHEARLFKQLNVHGPSLPPASSDNSDYDTAEEGDGPERLQQNGHGQAAGEASAEADSLALPPGLSMGGPLMHNLPDEVIGFESDEEPMAESQQQGPAMHELQMGAAAGSQFQGDRMLAQTAASGHNNQALEHRGSAAAQQRGHSQSTWSNNGHTASGDDGWGRASPEKGVPWGVDGARENGVEKSVAEQTERPVRKGPPGFAPGQTFSPEQRKRPPGFARALTEATSDRSRGAKTDLRDRLNRSQDLKPTRGMENGFAQAQEPSNPFQQSPPHSEPNSHPMVPSQQEVPGSEVPRGRAPRPDMPVYTGPKVRRSVTPEYGTPPGGISGGPSGPFGQPPRSPLENGHAPANGVPGEQMATQGFPGHALETQGRPPMETLRAPGAFMDRTPSSDARGRSQDRRPPSLPRVRPLSSAAMARQEDGGSLAGFVPLDSLQRPARWADDGEDEGSSPFAPQPPTFARSASGQLQNGHAQPSSPVKDWSEQFPGLTLGGQPAAGRQANGHAPPPPDLAAAQEFPSLGAAPAPARGGAPRAASPASALTASAKASAWSNGGGAAISRNLQAQQSLTSLGTPAAAPAPLKPAPEQLELQRNLRVASDEASDTSRKRQCRSKVDFELIEKVRGRDTNTVSGLELHTDVLSPLEQAQMVQTIERWVASGKRGEMQGRTFSAPRRSMPGKGRITCQFGCCYNYAVDQQGRKPGIIAEEIVEAMPPELEALSDRLVRWGIVPRAIRPNSAIINVYEPGDCIPPHIDHHDFVRPFVTLSLLSEQPIMFGQRLIPLSPGNFGGSDYYIRLPQGSCLVLKGNGADVAMHCVPPVAQRRMSITLRRMADVHSQSVQREIQVRQEKLARERDSHRW